MTCSRSSGLLAVNKRSVGRWTALLMLMLVALPAVAQTTQAPADYQNFLHLFLTTTQNWAQPLRTLATATFWALAFIELNIVFWPLALQGATLGEFSWAMVKLILFLGFFYALVLNGSGWMLDIIQSFSQAGAQAGGAANALTPVDMLQQALQAGLKLMQNTSIWHPIDRLGIEIAALIVVICLTVVAAILGLILLESYILVGAASFFFAFGGCRFTSDYARHVFQSAVTVGAKLLLLQLLVASANPLINGWIAAYQQNDASTFGLIALVLIFCLACAMIPSVVNRLLGGAGSGGALGTVVGAAGMIAGAAAAGAAAAKLATAQMGGAAGAAAGAGVEGSAAASLASAATAAPGGLPEAVANMPGMGGGSETAASMGSSSNAGGLNAGPLSGRAAAIGPRTAGRGDPDAIKARLDAEAAGAETGSAANDNAAAPGGEAATAATDSATAAPAAGESPAFSTTSSSDSGSSAVEGTADTIGAANDNTGSAGAAADLAKTGTMGGAGAAGEHAARTLANFAGHVLKHADSSNPFKAAAGEMDSKASSLSGSDKPGTPAAEPPMATTGGGTISGGAKLDPEQPLSGDQPAPAAPTPATPPSASPSGSDDDTGAA